jgi:ELWxxDGT repeat protein
VLFAADTSPNGFNLWTSDGTAAGTYELSSTAYSPNSFTTITITTTACFAAGTRILTEHGPVTVESLAVGPREISTGSGHRIGPPRHRGSTAYAKQHERGKRKSSPPCCITSTRPCFDSRTSG